MEPLTVAMTEDEESTVLRIYEQAEDIAKEYAVETWLEQLGGHTFRTDYFLLSVDEATALKNSFKSLTKAESDLLQQLEKKIDVLLQNFGGVGFVKLSTRSPKDAVFELKNQKVLVELEKEFSNVLKSKGVDNITNDDRLLAMTNAANRCMKVHSGKEAMQLLCQSWRVFTDVNRALQDPSLYLQCIVREWVEIPVQNEFRGFVCKGNFNGLSQYFHYIFFKEIRENKVAIENRIRKYWETVKQLIPHESYVIDFAILSDGSIKVIEINPFHYSTGAPFFTWKKGSEGRKVLLNGPFEFRFRQSPATDEDKEKYLVGCYEQKMLDLCYQAKGGICGSHFIIPVIFTLLLVAYEFRKE